MSYFRSKHMAAARSLCARDWEKPADIIRARRLADHGSTVAEIAAALGWSVQYEVAKRRLKKYCIRPFPSKHGPGAHRGLKATLPPRVHASFEVYRPKAVR